MKYLPLYSLLHEKITIDQFIATAFVSMLYVAYVQLGSGSIYNTYASLYGQHEEETIHKTPTSIFYDSTFMV